MVLSSWFLMTNYMLPSNTVFKSFLPPAIAKFNGITYVVPGWHPVPEGTTLEEANKYWVKDIPSGESSINPTEEVQKTVISKRTGEEYTVRFSGRYWSCTCMGFGFRGRCKHVEEIKKQYINHAA
jgi:hypothetical protein